MEWTMRSITSESDDGLKTLLFAAFALSFALILAGCGSTPPTEVGDVRPGASAGEPIPAAVSTSDVETDSTTSVGSTTDEPTAVADAQSESNPAQTDRAVRLVPSVHAEHPHDVGAFTQGLLLHDGHFYESTGLNGRSSLRRVDPASGDVLAQVDIDERFFAEGLALVDGRLIQLTWQAGEAFVYDAESLEPLNGFKYEGEGWGLCYDGERLVMSDGGSSLEFRDPITFEPIGEIEVTLDGGTLKNLNELECVGDRIWSNVWLTDMIVEIDPTNGAVTSVVDAARLKAAVATTPGIDVLNGIAHDPETGRFFVTGKQWPTVFEVDFVTAGAEAGGGG